MVCIAVLNWNGYDDTVECLDSLGGIDCSDHFIIVGDNGSTDGSLERLDAYFKAKGRRVLRTRLGEETWPELKAGDIVLYDLLDNNGFSLANNMMVRFGAHYSPEYFLLLNNDTAVQPDFLSRLVEFRKQNPEYKVLTPLILYYRNRDTVWNGGGRIRWGFRKYRYKDRKASEVREESFIGCSFVTGCCMLFTPDVLTEEDGRKKIFTEKFFYGEEDFELALRLRRQKVRMACVTGSVIYHKVSASVGRHSSKTGPVYIHFLNRLIDVRDYMHPLSYFFYRMVLCATLAMYLRKSFSYSPARSLKFIRTLLADARGRSSVPKDYCLEIFNGGGPIQDISR